MYIKECCVINPLNKANKEYINYIDTSSVNDGSLLNYQTLFSNFPSRAQRNVEQKDIGNCVASTGFIQIRCKNMVCPRYIYYLLTCKKSVAEYIMVADSSQTTFPTFNKNVIENIKILHEDLSTQQHIVDTIGSVDDAIEKNEEIISKIKAYGNKLFKIIDTNVYINATDIIEFEKGVEIGAANYYDKEIANSLPYIRVGNLLNNNYDTFCIDNNYRKCDYDDILIAFDGAPGRNSIGLYGVYSSGIYKIKCDNKYKGFVYFYINSNLCQDIIRQNSQGTTILHASKSINLLKMTKIDNNTLLEKFNCLFNKMINIYKKQITLRKIKQELLSRFFD